MHILMVDDNAINLTVLKSIVSRVLQSSVSALNDP